MADPSLNDFLTDPDDDARRLELTAYFTPNPAPFLKTYELLRERALAKQAGQRVRFRFGGMCVPAFFFGPVWFFYRKLWGWAVATVVLLAAVPFMPDPVSRRIGLPLGMALGLAGRHAAVNKAIGRLQAMRQAGQPLGVAQIIQAGGVSRLAGWISGVVLGVLIALSTVAMFYLWRHGYPAV